MPTSDRDTEQVLNLQEDEVLIEIDPSGKVSRQGDGPDQSSGRKTVLHDPRGEYLR